MATVEELILKVAELTEYERTEFLGVILEKYGIKADPIPAVGVTCEGCGRGVVGPHACPGFACAPAYGGPPLWDDPTEFSVGLSDVGPNKIMVIKVVRDLLGIGLKETKDIVDAVAAGTPQLIKENVTMAERDSIQRKLEESGARVWTS
jgi:large subunit ribosomal protein L7/L12